MIQKGGRVCSIQICTHARCVYICIIITLPSSAVLYINAVHGTTAPTSWYVHVHGDIIDDVSQLLDTEGFASLRDTHKVHFDDVHFEGVVCALFLALQYPRPPCAALEVPLLPGDLIQVSAHHYHRAAGSLSLNTCTKI